VDAQNEEKPTLAAKVIGIAAAIDAAWLAQQLVNMVWTRLLGHKPPKPEDEGTARFREIAAAATVTGGVIALARVLATRGAAKIIR
jgi:hypothetical protein